MYAQLTYLICLTKLWIKLVTISTNYLKQMYTISTVCRKNIHFEIDFLGDDIAIFFIHLNLIIFNFN